MKNALIVTNNKKSVDPLKSLLTDEGYSNFEFANSSEEVKNLIGPDKYQLILINSPLADEPGFKLAVFCARMTRSSIVIISPEDVAMAVTSTMSENGVLTIQRPLNKHLFHHYILFIECYKKRLMGVLDENVKLKKTVEDMKLIDRAKMLLIQCLQMSENQAHHYLEKQAMDLRVSKRDVAVRVIKTYDY